MERDPNGQFFCFYTRPGKPGPVILTCWSCNTCQNSRKYLTLNSIIDQLCDRYRGLKTLTYLPINSTPQIVTIAIVSTFDPSPKRAFGSSSTAHRNHQEILTLKVQQRPLWMQVVDGIRKNMERDGEFPHSVVVAQVRVMSQPCAKYRLKLTEVEGHFKCTLETHTTFGQFEVCIACTRRALEYPRMLCVLLLLNTKQ